MMEHNKRLIARYAIDRGKDFELVTRFFDETVREPVEKDSPWTASIMPHYPSAIWFERKIRDDFGIRFKGAFDHRPLLHHERFPQNLHPMRKDFSIHAELESAEYRPYKYETIGGDGVFEVSVGPIHAGIIEPGHFHFSQAGEGILHQEVRHFYKYRGIEKMLEGKTLQDAAPIVSRISGNNSVAYQTALWQIVEKAAGFTPDDNRRKSHALLLELERIIHHWTDLGFIPNDAGFAAALAFASARAEESRRMMANLTGHRFGFDALGKKLPSQDTKSLISWVDMMERHIKWYEEWIGDIPSLWDRFDTTGVLNRKDALKYGCVGVMARASGVMNDVRESDPWYIDKGFVAAYETGGDVAARFRLRITELKNSLQMMRTLSEKRETEPIRVETLADGEYESFVESSLGELYMVIGLRNGRIERFFSRDPSFVNWQALHLMMPGNIIADFPLINKSCDLSYAGNDL